MMRYIQFFTVALFSCFVASAQEYSWERTLLDGSRTGCAASSAENVEESIGRMGADKEYYSPSGKVYPAYSSIARVASIVLAAQPKMADLKVVVAHSAAEMPHMKTEGVLSNWLVDIVAGKVSELSGKKIDVAICNFGGIRRGMPEGEILLDDIRSMFPFKNNLVHLRMKGNKLREIFESMAAGKFEALGGVTIEVSGGRLLSVMVGDSHLDDDKVYDVASISFLLKGGDGLYLADASIEVDRYDVIIGDAVMEYVDKLTSEGKQIVGPDVRHVIIK